MIGLDSMDDNGDNLVSMLVSATIAIVGMIMAS
jgi:hypothetical protein